jgi:hypothetical protein
MPNYELVFIVTPSGMFGVPEDGKTIYPSSPTGASYEIVGPALDTLTGNPMGYGTLSKYRDVSLSDDIILAEASLHFQDNYAFLNLTATDDAQALQRGVELVSRFCSFLSFNCGSYCSAELLQATTERRRLLLPKAVQLLALRTYNLSGLSSQIADATAAANVPSNPVLDKAVAYFYHALLMSEQQITNPLSTHSKLMISEVILNYYKAVSTIIGDPSVDNDYQSRYKRFGIPKPLWDDAERLRKLRNEHDIAHYRPDLGALENIQQHRGFASATAQAIIKAYIRWLETAAHRPSNPQTL